MALPTLHKDTKPFVLGVVAGAIISVWSGFDAMGWKTGAVADAMAKKQGENAVIAAYAKVCSAQFNSSKDANARLAILKNTDRYSRGDLVGKSGHATMIGDKEPVAGVAQACAELLIPEKTL